jgi:hypothetical protein
MTSCLANITGVFSCISVIRVFTESCTWPISSYMCLKESVSSTCFTSGCLIFIARKACIIARIAYVTLEFFPERSRTFSHAFIILQVCWYLNVNGHPITGLTVIWVRPKACFAFRITRSTNIVGFPSIEATFTISNTPRIKLQESISIAKWKWVVIFAPYLIIIISCIISTISKLSF